jgi:hypothetical protein
MAGSPCGDDGVVTLIVQGEPAFGHLLTTHCHLRPFSESADEPGPHCGQLIMDWHNEWYDAAQRTIYFTNHPAGQKCGTYWQQSEVQQADQQVTQP